MSILAFVALIKHFDPAVTLNDKVKVPETVFNQFLFLSCPGAASVNIKVITSYNYSGILFDLPCTPPDNFTWVPYFSLGPPIYQTLCPKFILAM